MTENERHGNDGPEEGLNRKLVADIMLSAAFLTRLPVSVPPSTPCQALASAMRVFPVVGAGIGLAGGVVFALAASLGMSWWLSATFALAAMVLITGALHEDALADVADGFGGGRDRDAKLHIMRDSRVGTYGVLALVVAVVARIAALAALEQTGLVIALLIAAGAASRCVMPAVMHFLEPARADGLGADAGKPDRITVYWAAALAFGIAVAALGVTSAVACLAAAAAAAWGMARLAKAQVGGYTGDVLGACGLLAEIAFMAAGSVVLQTV